VLEQVHRDGCVQVMGKASDRGVDGTEERAVVWHAGILTLNASARVGTRSVSAPPRHQLPVQHARTM
jgi:hypothetical protein